MVLTDLNKENTVDDIRKNTGCSFEIAP